MTSVLRPIVPYFGVVLDILKPVMVMYKAHINITLRPSILDPQGKATAHALHSLGFSSIDRVRIGKYVEMWVDAADEAGALQMAKAACQKLLANEVMEDFEIRLEAVTVEPA